jgi:hypothetical protein
MRKINCFVEDTGHQAFLQALVRRLSRQHRISIELKFENARGGHGTAISELKQYIRDLQRGRQGLPDMLIVATDGNCKGFIERKQEIEKATKSYTHLLICAVPDPHVERWLLLDSAAFKKVLGVGCKAPTYKCERDLYKRLLENAVIDAGKEPFIGGIEYAEALVDAMNLDRLERSEPSLGHLLRDLRQQFQAWQQEQQAQP